MISRGNWDFEGYLRPSTTSTCSCKIDVMIVNVPLRRFRRVEEFRETLIWVIFLKWAPPRRNSTIASSLFYTGSIRSQSLPSACPSERVKHLYVFNILCVAAVAKLGIAADSYLSVAQRIISRSRVQIPPAAYSKYCFTLTREHCRVYVYKTMKLKR